MNPPATGQVAGQRVVHDTFAPDGEPLEEFVAHVRGSGNPIVRIDERRRAVVLYDSHPHLGDDGTLPVAPYLRTKEP